MMVFMNFVVQNSLIQVLGLGMVPTSLLQSVGIAWSNTIHAEEIEIIKGFPESIIKFRLENEKSWIERPLHRWRRVRPTSGEQVLRPTFLSTIEIAGHDHPRVEIALADRSKMKHRIILGRNFLRIGYIINPNRQCIHTMVRSKNRITIANNE